MNVAYWAERIGSLMAGGGIAWAVYVATENADLSEFVVLSGLRKILLETGPMEVCALGVVIWIWAKWRRSIRVR